MEQANKQKSKKVLKTIGNIIFTLFMIVMASVIVLAVISKKMDKPLLKYSMMWVLTDSMEPVFYGESYILVKQCDVNSLKKGDIITFVVRDGQISGSYNTHRIYEVVREGKEFITKGDNCSSPDSEHVFAEDIVYKYVCNLTLLTYFGRAFSSTIGLVLTIAIILIFIIVYLIITINSIKKENAEKTKQKEIEKLVAEEVKRLEDANIKEKDDK